MAVTTLERATARVHSERSWVADGSSALTAPIWVEPVRPAAPPAPAQGPLGEVIPLRPVLQPAVQRRLRLTRRGRLTVTLGIAGCLLAVAAVATSSAATAERPASAPASSVVVEPGDTLWGLAVQADPQADPRITVARIIELNDLSGGHIRPGQRLQLPTR